jgi:hypothetical protein
MKQASKRPSVPLPRHLHSREAVARAVAHPIEPALLRRRGQGNGARVHAIYFVAVSLAALVLVIGFIVFGTTLM